MTILQAIILGVVQGLTEFLPVSSSGHLVLVQNEFLSLTESPTLLAFDVLLHLATVVAVAGYFARDIRAMFVSFVAPGRLQAGEVKGWRRLTLWLIVGTVPAGLAGVLLEDFFISLFDSTAAVGAFLLLTAGLLTAADFLADRAVAPRREVGDMGLVDVLIVGLFQALAIAPGLSRSGSTISGGVYLGLSREAAARFSFLLSVPVILGAGLMSLGDLAAGFQGGDAPAYVAGALAGLVSGVLAVHCLLRYLRKHRLRAFAVYTFAVGCVVLLLAAF
ncbi:MAG: undecaprenyl-diphosphate phosphatase [Thermoleophilia bacterium]|nr:undecaprenyl-diphosphate phosphatase [Thermoleophilia bacterium]